ncbi:hypothetical protein ACFQV4_14830 [Streptomyces thermocarboxydus]
MADAAELLAQQILAVRMPGRAHGRPVFAEDLDGLLAACRAEARTGEEVSVGGVAVPVRTVSYRGTALAGSVLAEVWHRHHAARGPLVRWLRGLAGDPAHRCGYARPWSRVNSPPPTSGTASRSSSGRCRRPRTPGAATSPRPRSTRPPAASRTGRRCGCGGGLGGRPGAALRWTAALALGSGRIVDDTRRAMELLCGIGGRDDGAHALVASFGATRLVAGSRAGEAATVLCEWAEHGTDEQIDLTMLCAVRLFCARTDDMWQAESGDGPDEPPAESALSAPSFAGRVWRPAGCGSRAGRRGSRAAPGRTP